MRLIKLLASGICLSILVACQGAGSSHSTVPTPAAVWYIQAGTVQDDQAVATAVDASGNIFVLIQTRGAWDGAASYGGVDAALIKYTASGQRLWTAQTGTANDDFANAMVMTADAIYIAGYTTVATGNTDIFVAKYSFAGQKAWLKTVGTAKLEEAWGIAADASGIYIAGMTNGDINVVGSGIYNDNVADVLVVKMDTAGNVGWMYQGGSTLYDRANAIVVNSSGVFVAGYTFGNYASTNAGDRDAILTRLELNGAHVWSKQFGGSQFDVARAISGSETAIYVAGQTSNGLSGANAGGTCKDDSTLVDITCRDIVVVAFDLNGQQQWIYQTGSAADDRAFALSLAGGALYVGGFAGGALDGQAHQGAADMITIKMAIDGTLQWARMRGTASSIVNDEVHAITVVGDEVFVAGWSDGNLEGHASIGGIDAFVFKYSAMGSTF